MRQDFTRINFGWLGYWAPDETTIGTQPDMLEYVTSLAAAWDCPISIHSNLKAFAAHPRTEDNLEVIRRWEEVRAGRWLTKEQKKQLQNVNQEHHLLLNEHSQFELYPYEQITNVAGGRNEVRAFIFKRKGEYYVLYWHISGDKKLKLSIDNTGAELYRDFVRTEKNMYVQKNKIIIPVGNRRYLKISNATKEQLIEAFANAEVLD